MGIGVSGLNNDLLEYVQVIVYPFKERGRIVKLSVFINRVEFVGE